MQMNSNTQYSHRKAKSKQKQLLGLFVCVCIALCAIVAHNTAQNRPDNFPSYPPDNHHCSDDIYLREGGASAGAIVLSSVCPAEAGRSTCVKCIATRSSGHSVNLASDLHGLKTHTTPKKILSNQTKRVHSTEKTL